MGPTFGEDPGPENMMGGSERACFEASRAWEPSCSAPGPSRRGSCISLECPRGRPETDEGRGGRRRCEVKRVDITSAKLNVVFPEGKLPAIPPDDPSFLLDLGGVQIVGQVSAKAARKLAQHTGGAVLQGKLVAEGGKLSLLDAGFTWIDPKPKAGVEAAAEGGGQ